MGRRTTVASRHFYLYQRAPQSPGDESNFLMTFAFQALLFIFDQAIAKTPNRGSHELPGFWIGKLR
jgi:hypothetical protein